MVAVGDQNARMIAARLGPCLAILAAVVLAAGPVLAWPEGYLGRLQAEALLQTLRADLLTHDSATAVLTRWCATHHLADPPRIVARRVKAEAVALSPETRALLAVGPRDAVSFRHVELVCGDHVLSIADNWYVPARLTPAMRRALASTDTPFGVVVAPLKFRRRTVDSELLFRPLPEGWESGDRPTTVSGESLVLPSTLLRHRAVLSDAAGRPFSLVVEDYQSDLLAFEPAPAAP